MYSCIAMFICWTIVALVSVGFFISLLIANYYVIALCKDKDIKIDFKITISLMCILFDLIILFCVFSGIGIAMGETL